MPNHYYFAPTGETRRARVGEFIDGGAASFSTPVIRSKYNTANEFDIYSLTRFDSDPFRHVREVYEKRKSIELIHPSSQEEANKQIMLWHGLGVEALNAISDLAKSMGWEKEVEAK